MLMKKNLRLITLAMLVLTAASCSQSDPSQNRAQGAPSASPASPQAATSPASPASPTAAPEIAAGHSQPTDPHGHGAHGHGADAHGHDASSGRVPAFEVDAVSLKNLPPTLAPEKFSGRQQRAYQLVKEIPETIAQLPCYCYCDQGIGHKSLHSCYVDDHAAHCGVCVDEVLVAYQLQKEEKLTPSQIRERIIKQFSK